MYVYTEADDDDDDVHVYTGDGRNDGLKVSSAKRMNSAWWMHLAAAFVRAPPSMHLLDQPVLSTELVNHLRPRIRGPLGHALVAAARVMEDGGVAGRSGVLSWDFWELGNWASSYAASSSYTTAQPDADAAVASSSSTVAACFPCSDREMTAGSNGEQRALQYHHHHLTCLKLGKRQYYVEESGAAGAAMKRERPAAAVPRCQVDGCGKVLADEKEYHKRHKVCELHSKSPKVIVLGVEQRFCQQCSRAALNELIAENRAAGLAHRLHADRGGWHAVVSGEQPPFRPCPHHQASISQTPVRLDDGWSRLQEAGDRVTLDLMNAQLLLWDAAREERVAGGGRGVL
ncbi:hypothetical protein BHM03_00035238 [Ensete ventricosum]|nr:hypothetical protein BHM03_00035238 [Ensete ventricosum]